MRVIDGDSHFVEPLDLWERFIEPKYRDRAACFRRDPASGELRLVIDRRALEGLSAKDILSTIAAFGQKEEGRGLEEFDPSRALNPDLYDMEKRIRFLDEEGIDTQIIYPTLALAWECMLTDPDLAAAHCMAYNTWAFGICGPHKRRLCPVAHISLLAPELAVRELRRVAKLGGRSALVAAIPINGRSFGHPDYDPVWAAAQDLDMAIGVHLSFYPGFGGSQWYRNQNPGYSYMFLQMGIKQEPRTALTTMVIDGVFERFPRLRVATVEAKSGWVGEWVERMDYFYQYTGKGTRMKRAASEYFTRNIWIGADPDEKMLPPVVQLLGDDKFFIGSDYPHAEGYMRPIETARDNLSRSLPARSVDKILGANAAIFYGV